MSQDLDTEAVMQRNNSGTLTRSPPNTEVTTTDNQWRYQSVSHPNINGNFHNPKPNQQGENRGDKESKCPGNKNANLIRSNGQCSVSKRPIDGVKPLQ